MSKGLLLGAGASYDFGLPLVKKVDPEFKQKLTAYFSTVVGCPREIVDEVLGVLGRDNMNYESMIGYFQLQSYRMRGDNELRHHYHYISSLFYRVAADIIWMEQRKNEEKLLSPDALYLGGFKSLAAKNRPLWIFSLNYDSVVECIGSALEIDVCSGLKARSLLPRRDASGRRIGEVQVETLDESDITSYGLIFPPSERDRINLVKLHGSLDMFTFADGKNLMKLVPTVKGPQGVLDALFGFRSEVALMAFPENGVPISPDEFLYIDDFGVRQFLRHTLVAGSFKFDKQRHQTFPHKILDSFAFNINYVKILVCIGYGFGDDHVNRRIRNWLEFTDARRIEIVDPQIKSVPNFLLHVAPQVTLYEMGAKDYCAAQV
jgi:hypothetical protein